MYRNDTHASLPRAIARISARKWIVFLGTFAAAYFSAGIAIDFGKAHAAEIRLQSAAWVVASALAAQPTRAPLRSLQLEAERRLAPEIAAIGDVHGVVFVTIVGQSIRVSATASIDTVFLSLLRYPRLTVGASSTIAPTRARTLHAAAFLERPTESL